MSSSLLKTWSMWTELAEVIYNITHTPTYTHTVRVSWQFRHIFSLLKINRFNKIHYYIAVYLHQRTAPNLLWYFLRMDHYSNYQVTATLVYDNFNTASTSHLLWGDITLWLFKLFWFLTGVNWSSLAPPVQMEFHSLPINSTSLVLLASKALATGLANAKLGVKIGRLFFEKTKGIQTRLCCMPFLLFFLFIVQVFVTNSVWSSKKKQHL